MLQTKVQEQERQHRKTMEQMQKLLAEAKVSMCVHVVELTRGYRRQHVKALLLRRVWCRVCKGLFTLLRLKTLAYSRWSQLN